jgi:alpha-D-xyloside xylohydrolase
MVFAGADASFDLYEDEGTNYDYENGLYTTIPISWDNASRELTIGDREGRYDEMLESRTFRVIVVDKGHPGTIDDLDSYKEVKYSGSSQIVEL